jgi:hypothetical protein
MGTTVLGIVGALAYPVSDVAREWRKHRWDGVKEHWKGRLRTSAGIALLWWSVLFLYHFIYAIPTQIRVDSEAANLGPRKIPLFDLPGLPPFWDKTTPITQHPPTQPPIQRVAKFSVMIPFDTAPDAAPIPRDENPDDPLYHTYQEMGDLATRGTIPDSARESRGTGQITWKANPVSMKDSTTFLGRLLQYDILASIDSLQRNMLTVYVGRPAEAQAGIEPPDAEIYPDEKLSQLLAENRFFKPFLYRSLFGGIKRMKLPKGTTVEFTEEGTPPGKFYIAFKRPAYFKADFEIEPFAGTGTGNLPKHFATAQANTTMQWPFFVTMRYSIEHPNDRTFNPETYARWLDTLYGALAKKFEVGE